MTSPHMDIIVVGLIAGMVLVLITLGIRKQGKQFRSTPVVRGDERESEVSLQTLPLSRLRPLTGLSDSGFEALYVPLIRRAEAFLMPISRHVTPTQAASFALGGLMERLTKALTYRRAVTFEPGQPEETTRKNWDRWTYAVACAVVCRYVLGAVQSVEVALNTEPERRLWNPLLGPIEEEEDIADVIVWRAPRCMPSWRNVLMLRQVVPRDGLAWLLNTGAVFSALASTVTRVVEVAHPLADLVCRAEGDQRANSVGARKESAGSARALSESTGADHRLSSDENRKATAARGQNAPRAPRPRRTKTEQRTVSGVWGSGV